MGQPNHASLIIVIQNFWKSLPDLFRNIIGKTKKTVKKVASLNYSKTKNGKGFFELCL